MRNEEYVGKSGVRGTAAFSDDGVYRYALGRVWDDTAPAVAFIMLNPSTATADLDDPTIRRCIGFAQDLDAGGILVVNVFAVRATDPKELLTLADPVGPGNHQFVRYVIGSTNPLAVIAAWGAFPLAAQHAVSLLGELGDVQLHCLGRNKDGSPKHPLYLSASTRLSEYP